MPYKEALRLKYEWKKKAIVWTSGRTLYCSVPFTWNLPVVRDMLNQRNFFWDKAVIGGPAVRLMPDFFSELSDYVSIGGEIPGMLQKFNPLATRTTVGCIRKCSFCAVPKTEGVFKELTDWPDFPIICDNNLLASSEQHFDKVMNRLEKHGWADFNQGLDCRILKRHHARRFSRIRPMIRLALDNLKYKEKWQIAFEKLRLEGIPKSCIRCYALIGFDSDPEEAWLRCNYIEKNGIMALPMWYHSLDQTQINIVSNFQKKLGWNETERKKIMGWFYKHRGQRLYTNKKMPD